MSSPRSVVLAGGGSAGHVSPLLSVAHALERRDPEIRITVLGTATGLEERLVPAAGYALRMVDKVPFPRRPDRAALRFPMVLRAAIGQAGQVLDQVQAGAVVGFGGYVSTPAYLAARRRGLPIVVHEANARPGMANKLGARFAAAVAVTFPGTPLPKAQVIGLPLRPEIAGLDRAARREEALAELGLKPDLPTILVTGGSLGAQRINEAFRDAAPALQAAGVQVLHLTGAGKEIATESGDGAPYRVLPYLDRMELAYAVADLVVCRAGANTVCELAAVGLPACYVPLPVGNGEQRLNAVSLVDAGGGLLVNDDRVDAEWVQHTVLPLITAPERLAEMGAAAAAYGRRDADDAMVDLILRAVAEAPGRGAR